MAHALDDDVVNMMMRMKLAVNEDAGDKDDDHADNDELKDKNIYERETEGWMNAHNMPVAEDNEKQKCL